jgi:hypothetical protein
MSVILLSLIILALVVGISVTLLYYTDKNEQMYNFVNLYDIRSELKSGDLILYQAKDASPARLAMMFGRWTHVGIVNRRLKDNQLFIFDCGFSRSFVRLEKMLHQYQSGECAGVTVVRRLNQSLSFDQEEIFQQWLQDRMIETTDLEGNNGIQQNASGEWFGRRPNTSLISEILMRQAPLCFANHIMNSQIPFDTLPTDLLCTDGIMNILIKIGIVDSSKVPSCLIPNFFSTRPYDSLNLACKNDYRYGSEIDIKCN